ncbi:MAG: NAD(P)-dependent oxidoreductase [Betaproteobacteria bacterium]|nr:NAD(P)-dependent oxidoreductase [Betaproteobacteria bacterium]
MIVAITGGTGFIGRHLIARHCARGDQVRYLTRKSPSENVAGASAFVGDLTSPVEQLEEFARGADVMYHCAAELRDEAKMQQTNVRGTANLIAAAGGEIGRWVQLSSTGVYGRKTRGDVFEETAVNPANAYEISKATADKVLLDASLQQDFSCVVVRPSNVYATDMPNQSLFQLIRAIDRGMFFFVGGPGAIANYIHVENVVDALVLCATASLPGNGRKYIVSEHRKLEELIQVISAALARTPPRLRLPESLIRAIASIADGFPGFPLSSSRVDALTNSTVYRADRISSELGYANRISMEAGMSELARHWRSRGNDA